MSSAQQTGKDLEKDVKDVANKAGDKASETANKVENKASDAGKKVEQGAKDAGKKADDAGSKAKSEASNTANKAESKANKAESKADKKTKKGGDGPDKEKLKVIGAGVAVAAALIFGGVKVYKSRSNEPEVPSKGKAQEKVDSGFNWFGKKSDQASHKADKEAPDAKAKAVEIKDNVVSGVKSAADQTKSGLSDAKDAVAGSTKDARHKVNEEKSGNVFEAIGNWFNDRKDDASHAASKTKHAVEDTGKKAKK